MSENTQETTDPGIAADPDPVKVDGYTVVAVVRSPDGMQEFAETELYLDPAAGADHNGRVWLGVADALDRLAGMIRDTHGGQA